MDAMRQSCRPKHQVLILKCYPKLQKDVVAVKANASELSYLLYYASTRRSKLQKVGAFLEKRTIVDVSKARTGNVQVTVQILKALIEKIPRDLPLYARYVLRILDIILRSGDLTVTEETLSLFKTFCEHHDVATLAADQEHIGQYEEIVRIYANFAALDASPGRKEGVSTPVAIRWRSAGLQALQSVTSSEAVGADGGRQLNIIMPIILRNLHPEVEDYITVLAQRAKYTESADEEMARRRMSIATVRTSEVDRESYTGTVPGQPDDADRLAEEEVSLQALKDLKQIFTASNRAQIRMGTSSALKFICTTFPLQSRTASEAPGSGLFSSWPTALLEMIAGWTPVQDRFVILVTVVETMIRNPMTEENLVQQLLLINLVECLLRSSVNMIGLSVMDVLVGLIQHILLLLQLGGKGSNILPHHQQTDAIDLFTDDALLPSPPSLVQSGKKAGGGADVASASTNRQELLARLQRCIGDLATHIYYSDQISDIISAILLRLKPSPMSAVASDTAAVENPGGAAQAISSSANLQENRNTDSFFSFGTARVTALKAIKEVLIVANLNHHGGSAAVGRNRVSVQVWEGTQWLLRDHDRRVRRAYVDALLTWLRLEMTHNDLRVIDDKGNVSKISSKPNGDSNGWGHFTKRAVSLASQREKNVKPTKSTFLRLLHLAIYDNAIESPESDTEILLLHLLMVTLVEKLGVNAVKTGLPMVLKLQEDINDDEIAPTPSAKVKIGSLVHGYFWVLIEKFDLNSTGIGDEIDEEIARRKLHGLWLEAIQLPPVPLDQIMSEPTVPLTQKPPLPIVLTESLKRFDSCSSLVDQISLSYASSMASPPSSPPASPARVFSMPVLFSSAKPTPPARHELPSAIKDEMLSPWSKEICIATLERESPRAVSLSGSRNGTLLSVRQKYLGIKGNTTRNPSPTGQHGSIHGPTLSPNNNGVTSNAGLAFSVQETQDAQFKRSSAYNSGSPTPLSSSDHNPPLRIDELKRVLAGTASSNKARGASPLRNFINRRDFVDASNRNSISSGSESAVTANSLGSESERGIRPLTASSAPNHLASVHQNRAYTDQVILSKPHGTNRPLSQHGTDASRPPTRGTIRPSSSSSAEDPAANAKALRGDLVNPVPGTLGGLIDDDVPPVPPLPPGVSLQKNVVVGMGIGTSGPEGMGSGERGVNPRQGSKKRGVDVSALLGSIDVVAQDGGLLLGGGGKPPY